MHLNIFSSVARAASTAATERGFPPASGTTVSGKSVVFCNASTAISNGWPGLRFVAGRSSTAAGCSPLSVTTFAFSSISDILISTLPLSACPKSTNRTLLATQVDNQKAVTIFVRDRIVLDSTGKLYRLLKLAISNLHLLIRKPISDEGVAPAPADSQV